MFEGIRGKDYTSDMALDEIHLHRYRCIPKGNCDFDYGHGCGFSNDPNNKIDWLVYRGPTPSHNTGPRVDHTRGDKYGNNFSSEMSMICFMLFF